MGITCTPHGNHMHIAWESHAQHMGTTHVNSVLQSVLKSLILKSMNSITFPAYSDAICPISSDCKPTMLPTVLAVSLPCELNKPTMLLMMGVVVFGQRNTKIKYCKHGNFRATLIFKLVVHQEFINTQK